MATRKIRILAAAYSITGDVSVVVTFNGVEVHNGIVTTIATDIPAPPIARSAIMSFDVPDTLKGQMVSSSFAVTGGTLDVSGIQFNHYDVDPTINKAGSVNKKHNIQIDGVLIDAESLLNGTHYIVESGSTLEIDWLIPPFTDKYLVTDITIGATYSILGPANTDWAAIGASSSLPNTVFTATAVGTGNGSVRIA